METKYFEIPVDSFVAASSLGETFNAEATDKGEHARVSAVLEKATAFVKEVTPELLCDRQLLRERSWGDEVFLSRQTARQYSEATGAGYSLGDAGIRVSAETVENLQYLRDFFRLSSAEDAARLAIKCYAHLQNTQIGDSKYVMANEKGVERTPFNATPYYLKRNV